MVLRNTAYTQQQSLGKLKLQRNSHTRLQSRGLVVYLTRAPVILDKSCAFMVVGTDLGGDICIIPRVGYIRGTRNNILATTAGRPKLRFISSPEQSERCKRLERIL